MGRVVADRRTAILVVGATGAGLNPAGIGGPHMAPPCWGSYIGVSVPANMRAGGYAGVPTRCPIVHDLRFTGMGDPMLLERLFENLALTVEAFATCRVAPGWRLRLPALDWVTLHFVVDGSGSLEDGSARILALPCDSLALVPPRAVHAIQCGQSVQSEASVKGGPPPPRGLPEHLAGPAGDAALIVVCGRLQATYGVSLGLFDLLGECLVLDFSDEPRMRSTFEALLGEQRNGGPGAGVMMSALMNECLVQVFRRLCAHPGCELPWLVALEHPGLARVVDVVLAHPEQPHTVQSLAALAYMSRSAFAKRFRDSFGRTPMDYVRDVRLRRGAQLLRRDLRLSVDAIASRVGFQSRSQFSHAFHETFGCSPKEFRATAG
jgi:AraC family transcriptional activator of mtrCDE